MEDGHGGKKKRSRNVKKMVRKPRRNSFNLGGSIHLKPLEYDALKDEHLKSFFYSTRIRRHLEKQHLVIPRFLFLDHQGWIHHREPLGILRP